MTNLVYAKYGSTANGNQQILSPNSNLDPGVGSTSFKRPAQTPGGLVCDWTSNTGTLTMVSANAGESVGFDPSVTLDGQQGLKVNFAGTGASLIFDFVFNNPVSFAQFKTIQMSEMVTSTDTNNGVGTIQVWAMFNANDSVRFFFGQNDLPPMVPGNTSLSRFSGNVNPGGIGFGGAGSFAMLDTTPIVKFRVVIATTNAAAATAPVWLGPVRTDGRSTARLSIVMDGCFVSQYTIIKQLLDQYSIKVSLALTFGDIGRNNLFMTETQVQQFIDQGHEPINHTYNSANTGGYVNAGQWTDSASIAVDLKTANNYLRARRGSQGTGKGVIGFNSPFSGTAVARQKLVLDGLRHGGYECWRQSVNVDKQMIPIGNRRVVPTMLRGAKQIANTDTAQDLIDLINQAIENGEWAIVTIHEAALSSPTAKAMLIDYFKIWFAHAATQATMGNLIIGPMGEIYDSLFK